MSARDLSWTIVGVDCATQEERMGLARGVLDSAGKLRLERVTLGTAGESAAASVSSWIAQRQRYLIVLDAPLGWPKPLAAALSRHVAGAALSKSADELFRRHTDGVVHKALGKMPPDVGAGKIARTARAALDMLQAIRACSCSPIPLAWRQGEDSGAIEVYPAATLITRGVSGSGYKANTKDGRKARAELLARLALEIEVNASRDVMIEDANQFDAMVCVLAGADFARAGCVEPPDPELARREGFIWFRKSLQRNLFEG
jgi:predicted RNase H-like nuclease